MPLGDGVPERVPVCDGQLVTEGVGELEGVCVPLCVGVAPDESDAVGGGVPLGLRLAVGAPLSVAVADALSVGVCERVSVAEGLMEAVSEPVGDCVGEFEPVGD